MRLTNLTDYALRQLMYLGQNEDRLCTIAEIAQYHQISQAHLMKVTHLLSKGGWIQTQRGKNGGMRLARAPEDINLGELVRYTETDLAVVECLGSGTHCILSGRCNLSNILKQALVQFLSYLDNYTLRDIIVPGSSPEQTISWPTKSMHSA
ncbi:MULTISPECIES: RrF2 family transcriptional regulator [Alcaligenes]|jgi:Rrf2 family nitric oxide-sensitive transcriptional repressor|uniref:Rrf2 family transcriptional regulator n=2 Tax=Alcaligenes TaxID=507 RepID=A0AB33CXW3_ALCFA|nr:MULTISPECIES: Rrf2 family transcriptional regulator [Alcaligenes]ASR88512.1 Rrf2 family transcriptional regulator [Alcaligenes faecalis]AWG35752.1 Rrf2 family transcriptional regulator [Alcaligenes aquatilis]MCC9163697.1 Rrf2 family transcriptional regulator [Alcaligenes sp. MMA]MCH4225141.1 Rrf2 family transcriptional regulator [Alcaligenes faecalis]UQN36610.1 Rrf2 family transcriptional regulator [Alcaligenes aquatilis]